MPDPAARKKAIIAVGGFFLLALAVALLVLPGGSEPEPEAIVKEGTLERPRPGDTVTPGETAEVVMQTSEGSFVIGLDTTTAPLTANGFAYLAKAGFYDGLGFHRIVPGFVIQGGDPRGDGTGGPGYSLVEAPPADTEYGQGVVAMAKSGADPPGSSGSQFFIVTAPEGAGLPAEYAIVGEVSSGFDVVEKIGALGGPDEKPTRTVVIERARLRVGG